MNTDSPLAIRADGGTRYLELRRPEVRNALNGALLQALHDALAQIAVDETAHVVVLHGAGDDFCAGADLGMLPALRSDPLVGVAQAAGQPMWDLLGRFPKPVLAAVEGRALGGGCELALACDIVVASTEARFALPEVTLGLIPGGGGTQRLIHAVGKAKAMELLLTGSLIDATAAEAAGLVSRLTPPGQAVSVAAEIAGRIRRNSPLAVRLAKDAAQQSLEVGLHAGLAYERRSFHQSLRSADSHEGEAAFAQRRTPRFTEGVETA